MVLARFWIRPTSVSNIRYKRKRRNYAHKEELLSENHHHRDRKKSSKRLEAERENNTINHRMRGRTKTGDDLCREIITHAFLFCAVVLPPVWRGDNAWWGVKSTMLWHWVCQFKEVKERFLARSHEFIRRRWLFSDGKLSLIFYLNLVYPIFPLQAAAY